MKVLVLSDLHLEFGDLEIETSNIDVVILAGDIHIKEKGFKWAIENIQNIPVIYVLGNHEYYGTAYPKLIDKLKHEAVNSNIHFLENNTVTINDINFIGCTLWTDFELFGDPRISGYECQQVMTDYKKIRLSPKYSKLRSIDVAAIHKKSLTWLNNELKEREGQSNIVITHHAPSTKSLPEKYQKNTISAAYVSNLDDVIEKFQPKYWIHGHLHNSSHYSIGNTQVVCNPRGYTGEENYDFDSGYIIEIKN